ncbi:uncharacterized protein N7518_004938 [Penicillium psychrosexuale]|uniref:uncharacterized protein n=1 Tax=Penicillium psychrosexuale TaxID=1002107 RepID=UPI0025450C42|nr:uncharacterized protein N7518_004938 [Penicillium psychrosexuale]KAJ5796398.1 hypothetical protein N7518_004938 [Penicillium psychrosexuale]
MFFAFDQARNFTAQAGTWALKNPNLAACAVAGAGGVAVVAAPVLVTAPILSGLGFNTAGVAAGSFAAAIQSSIGNVAAGSLFAAGQSAGAGAGGLGLVAVNTAAQAAGVLTSVGSAGWAWFKGNHTC